MIIEYKCTREKRPNCANTKHNPESLCILTTEAKNDPATIKCVQLFDGQNFFVWGRGGHGGKKQNKTQKHFPNSADSLSCTSHVCKISDQKSNHSKREYINSHDVKFNFIYLLFKSAKWIVNSIPGSTNNQSNLSCTVHYTHPAEIPLIGNATLCHRACHRACQQTV